MIMNQMLQYKPEELEKLKGYITAKEIIQQPRLWKETYDIINKNKENIKSFLNKVLANKQLRIILTGAGSSAFVGECVAPFLSKKLEKTVEAIPTTDIVSNPKNYLYKDIPTLLISYARSGNSPESVGTVDLAENLIKDLYQVVVTCNPNGKLAQKSSSDDKKLLISMPKDSNDRGFAMTGSFTTMVLASLLLFDTDNLDSIESHINNLVSNGEKILKEEIERLKEISLNNFNRAVYLGSSSLKGLARESALKMVELTRGKITTSYDSPLGFRHGPKSILNDNTLVVVYLSNDKYTRGYEIDLLKEMSKEKNDTKVVAISHYLDKKVEDLVDYTICINEDKIKIIDDTYLIFNYILTAQIFSFYKSIELGISPDDPSPDGIVNRVVKGVTIYPYK
ncbi:SIS domain-containing protein [Dethiothermospora halolimnae]|uniref:SIS domain-containing protein n=1 Tax=Dethiothermospora halolimnae TaxID=3114390 RepID=UPI003CCBC596